MPEKEVKGSKGGRKGRKKVYGRKPGTTVVVVVLDGAAALQRPMTCVLKTIEITFHLFRVGEVRKTARGSGGPAW